MLELKEGYNGITDPDKLVKGEPIITKGKVDIETTAVYYKDIMATYQMVFESIDDVPENCFNYASPPLVLESQVPIIKVRYHKELCPDLIEMEKSPIGDFIDLRAAETVELYRGDFKLISLGISVQLPKGYHAEIVPRSSTYKNFGIIMSNSIGIVDESYCGDNDIWMFPAIALKDTVIYTNDRICQFRVVKNRDIKIEVVDELENKDRGGIGSTGKN